MTDARGIASHKVPIMISGDAPTLGRLAWLSGKLHMAPAPVAWGDEQFLCDRIMSRLDGGADVVIAPWPGVAGTRTLHALEILLSPSSLAFLGARAGLAMDLAGQAPDLVLDDHAIWALAAILAGRGARVDALTAPGVDGNARVAGRGKAWLIKQVMDLAPTSAAPSGPRP